MARVLLIIQRKTRQAAVYAPLSSILTRSGAKRLLNNAWLFEDSTSTVKSVRETLSPYLPCDDGVLVAEVGTDLYLRNGEALAALEDAHATGNETPWNGARG